MKECAVIAEYEKIMLGVKKNYPSVLFSGTDVEVEKNAERIIRYAFRDVLGWSPSDIIGLYTPEIAKIMKIDSIVKRLKVPEEFGMYPDSRYIAYIVYPDKVHFDKKQLAINVFLSVINNEGTSYPKHFFVGEDGTTRAKMCLLYILKNKMQFMSVEDMYEYFSKNSNVSKLAAKYHLASAFSLFDTPVSYLHQTIAHSQRNEWMNLYYSFRYSYSKQMLSRGKKKKKNEY